MLRPCLVVISFLMSVSVLGADTEGVRLLKSGQFIAARDFYQEVYAVGGSSEEDQFNYAMSLYQTQAHEEAKTLLVALIEPENNSVRVLFALAVIEQTLENYEAALDLFSTVYESGDAEFASLALGKIGELEETFAPVSPLFGFISVAAGRSDDVEYLDSTQLSGVRDDFHEMTAAVSWEGRIAKKHSLLIEAMAYKRSYATEKNQDFAVYSIALDHQHLSFGGDIAWQLGHEKSYAGSQQYLSTDFFSVGFSRDFLGARLGVAVEKKIHDSPTIDYAYAEGVDSLYKISYQGRLGELMHYYMTYTYGELDRTPWQILGESVTAPPTTLDQSSIRTNLSVGLNYSITAAITVFVDADVGEKTYDNFLSGDDVATYDKHDKNADVSLTVVRNWGQAMDIYVSYSYGKKDSTIDVYDYNVSVVKVGLSKQF